MTQTANNYGTVLFELGITKEIVEKTKEIFKAVVLDNMTYQQVGERFGITVNTVKTMYYRALKQLKEELGGNALVLFFIIRR